MNKISKIGNLVAYNLSIDLSHTLRVREAFVNEDEACYTVEFVDSKMHFFEFRVFVDTGKQPCLDCYSPALNEHRYTYFAFDRWIEDFNDLVEIARKAILRAAGSLGLLY